MTVALFKNVSLPLNLEVFSRPMEMGGGNGIEVSAVGISMPGAADVEVSVEEGNDLQNWGNRQSLFSLSPGDQYRAVAVASICSRYVRLVAMSAGGDDIIQAYVNVARL
jgi:hypothetical protein